MCTKHESAPRSTRAGVLNLTHVISNALRQCLGAESWAHAARVSHGGEIVITSPFLFIFQFSPGLGT